MAAETINGRVLVIGRAPDGTPLALNVDSMGNLVVQGAGIAPAATTIQVVDGSNPLVKMKVNADGSIDIGGTVALDATTLAALESTTVTVSNPGLTDTQLRAAPVPVSGPLTDTQLRASAVPVSGPLTDAQLRATPVPADVTGSTVGVTGEVEIKNDSGNAVPVSGTVTANVADTRSLTERMLSKAPQANYSLYLDTADATYIYIAEGPTADTATSTTAQGIRVVKDASGNPLGRVQIATAFAWNSRSAASWA